MSKITLISARFWHSCILSFFLLAAVQTTANAQQVMWGLGTPPIGNGASDNAFSHQANGHAAGQVRSAEAGVLFDSNISINSIGTQNIVNVDGSNNNITADQNGTNSGTVTNNSTLNTGN